MNMFARTARAFEEKKGQALAVLRKASLVASDETGVRIEGVNAYHWVFCCKSAIVHMADFTRSAGGRAQNHERTSASRLDVRPI